MSLENLLKKAVKVPASEWEKKMYQLLNRNRDTFLTETLLLVHLDVQALNLQDLLNKLVSTGMYKVYLGKLSYIHKASKVYLGNLDMMLSYMLHKDKYELFFVEGDLPFMIKKDKLEELKRRNKNAKKIYT